MQFRIGDRDPATGLYNVIHPDGSETLNGIKIFNAEHQTGDVVRMTRRSDGMLILEGVKAIEAETLSKEIEIEKFGEQPNGYLFGQVFNVDEEIRSLLTLTLETVFTEIIRGCAIFNLKVTLDRAVAREIKFKLAYTGTAANPLDYEIGWDGDVVDTDAEITIAAGATSVNGAISPERILSQSDKSLIVSIIPTAKIRAIGSLALTILRRKFRYTISSAFSIGRNANGVIYGPLQTVEVTAVEDDITLAAYESAWQAAIQVVFPNINPPTLTRLTGYVSSVQGGANFYSTVDNVTQGSFDAYFAYREDFYIC
jgi:hypothetical protein